MKKKVLALIMAAAMTFGTMGMSTTAFAATTAGTNQIVVSGVGIENESTTVMCGRIIKPDTTKALGWSFATTDIGDAFVDAWNATGTETTDSAEAVITKLITLGTLEETANKNATNGAISTGTNSDKFAGALKAVMDYATTPMLKGTSDATKGEATALSRETGLYVITAQSTAGFTYIPMAAYINTAGTGVNVTAKGSDDNINKTIEQEGQSVESGDTVQYTVKDSYPYFETGAQDMEFTITDTLTNATFLEDSMEITVGGEDYTPANIEYNNASQGNDKSTVVTITMTKDASSYKANLAGKEVVITYNAKVGTVNEEQALKNTVVSHKPGSEDKSYTVESDSAMVKVFKYNAATEDDKFTADKDEREYLNGAKFTVYRKATEEEIQAGTTKDIKYGTATIKVVVVNDDVTTETVDGKDGVAVIEGLDTQKEYYIEEKAAPTGYTRNEGVFKLTGAKHTATNVDNGIAYVTDTNFTDVYVGDTKISALPSTGGIGTTIFTIGGCVIMIAAAGIFFVSRKKENENK